MQPFLGLTTLLNDTIRGRSEATQSKIRTSVRVIHAKATILLKTVPILYVRGRLALLARSST